MKYWRYLSILTLVVLLGLQGNNATVNDNVHRMTDDERIDLTQLMEETYIAELKDGYGAAHRKNQTGVSDLPQDVHFYLYSNPQDFSSFDEIFIEQVTNTRVLWKKGKFDPACQWKFLIHGFLQDQNSSMPQLIVKEYLKRWRKDDKYRVNIVVVDWGRLAGNIGLTQAFPDYSKAVENVEVAGKRVGELIRFLKRLELEDLKPPQGDARYLTAIMEVQNIHIIGFSLGAHVAGKAGSYVADKLGRHIGRITGLDPAGPYFYEGLAHKGRILRKGDSRSLDIIHTNYLGFGIAEDIGDIDFYPNAGVMGMQIQPWCTSKFYVFQRATLAACSHNSAPIYFALSINHPETMKGCLCGSWLSYYTNICPCNYTSMMGEYWIPKDGAVGPYYLEISAESVNNGSDTLNRQRMPPFWDLKF